LPTACRSPRLALLMATVCLVLLPAALAQDAVTERVEVHSVSVPVQVSLRGEPLRGLTLGNFELFERGRKQRITGFEVIDLEMLKAPQEQERKPRIPIAGRRHFLVVFDMSFVRPGSLQLARREVREWVTRLDPTDLVAVSTYSINRGAKLLLNFSTDREATMLAMDNLGHLDLADTGNDPLVANIGAVSDEAVDMDFDRALEYGFYADAQSETDLHARDTYQGASQRQVDQERRQPINRLSKTFGELAHLMRSVEGRKYVVYLSEGFDSSLVFSDYKTERVRRSNTALEVGELWRIDTTRRFGSGPTQESIRLMLEKFRRADCVIQAVDLGRFRNPTGSKTVPTFSESLMIMANETGGELFRDFDSVGEALDGMLHATSLTYVLWYTPESRGDPGEFRKLKVKLKEVPKRARVSHRAGFHTPVPYAERGIEERRMAIGQLVMEGQEGGAISTSVLAAPFRLGTDRALVPVLIEIDGMSLVGSRDAGKLAAEIYAYAFDPQGGVEDFFTQTIQLDLDRIGPVLRAHGLKFYGEMELPAGSYTLRVVVLDRETGASGVTVQQIAAPAWLETDPVASAPLFPEPRGTWLMVREARLEQESGRSRYPFLLGVEPYMPAAAPMLQVQADRELVLPAYNLPQGPLEIRARVISRDGQTVRDIELPLVRRNRGGPDGAEMLVMRFPTPDLVLGRYDLVLTVIDPAGGEVRSRPVPFDLIGS